MVDLGYQKLEERVEWFKDRPELPSLTENQVKTIDQKYRRDEAKYSDWLGRVARNIALSELLYHPEFRDRALKGVHHKLDLVETGNGKNPELLLLQDGFADEQTEERYTNFRIFRANLYNLLGEDERARAIVAPIEEQFYELLSSFKFLPNSPTLMNAGRDLQQLSGCYVVPIDDTIEGWGKTVTYTMLIHKSGGGTGFSGARVRPKGDRVKSTTGIASGPLSVFRIVDAATGEVKQGGTRRGANMGILPVDHPDIIDFIEYKGKTPGELENFNVSVAVTEDFMGRVERNEKYPLINPRTKKIHLDADGKEVWYNAREIFDLMVQYAWATGDPGFVVIDRINNSTSNSTPALGMIESTNPCGEQPLLPFESCNLGSLNLSKFVIRSDREAHVDYQSLEEGVRLATRFLDDVIDANHYPLPVIERITKGNRRVGLGVMGLAETLAMLGIPYDSKEGVEKTRELIRFIKETSHSESERLAEERGVFPNFVNSIFDKNGSHFRGGEDTSGYTPRNCALITIAPTGTIALAAGLKGSGIEPFIALGYDRLTADGIEARKRGEKPKEEDILYEANPLFWEVARENDLFGLEERGLARRIRENQGSIKNIEEIPEEIRRIFPTSHDISIEYHIRHQAAAQEHTDNAVSKTLNFPHSATQEDVRAAYKLAYNLGCKGVTIYRDGSKPQQVLNLDLESRVYEVPQLMQVEVGKKHPLLEVGVNSGYYRINREGQNKDTLHIIFSDELYKDPNDGTYFFLPRKVFQLRVPLGHERSVDFAVEGVQLTEILKGSDPDYTDMITGLRSPRSEEEEGIGPRRIKTKHDAVGIALTYHLLRNGIVEYDGLTGELQNRIRKPQLVSVEDEEEIQRVLKSAKIKQASIDQRISGSQTQDKIFECSSCGSNQYTFKEGCHEPICADCGDIGNACG